MEKNDEDDIGIDFSGIKKFFKKKAPSHPDYKVEHESTEHHETHPHHKQTIQENHEKLSAEDDEKISLTAVKESWKKYQRIIIPLVLVVLAMSFSVYLRMQPDSLPITESWARGTIHSQIQSGIRDQVNSNFPNLPDQRKEQIVQEQFNQFIRENNNDVEQRVQEVADYFRAQLKDDDGNTYLIGIDPYFWYRHAQNVLEHGHAGDELRISPVDGTEYSYDTYMYAPIGRFMPLDMFHAYFIAYTYVAIHLINPGMTLVGWEFWVPVLLCALSVIPAFFITRRIAGNLGGFVAAVIIAIQPSYLQRTIGGFADTDPYNVLFPLVITWVFLEAYETIHLRKSLVLIGIASFLVGVYSFSWGGWWYVFVFLLASVALYFGYEIMRELFFQKKTFGAIVQDKDLRHIVIASVLFFLLSGVFVTLFTSFNTFEGFIRSPVSFREIKDVGTKTVWPNVFTTVAEQNEADFKQIIQDIGGGLFDGSLMFVIALVGIGLALLHKDSKGKHDVKFALLLLIWFIATIYASFKGIRWTLLLLPAFAIAVGITFGVAYRWGKKLLTAEYHIEKTFAAASLLFILFILFWSSGMAQEANRRAVGTVTDMNDAWYNALSKIDREASPDAIINSWWDFGHWFKAIGNRKVTFDGTSQGEPMAHWMGNVLLTSDEKTAVGLLRMMDCGSNKAFDALDQVMQKPYHSVKTLYEIVVLNRDDAKKVLIGHGLTAEQAESVLEYSHCDPPEDYFITSEDMIGKAGVWGHFGAWDFDKATQFNTLKNTPSKEESLAYLETEFNMTPEEAESRYAEISALGVGRDANDWIAPWPGYANDISSCSRVDNATFECTVVSVNVLVNTQTNEAWVETPDKVLHPNALVYVKGEDIAVKSYQNNTIGVSLIVIPNGEGLQYVVASPEQAAGMFTRLYYLRGHGLRYFKLFTEQVSPFGNHIYIWKVDWKGTEKNMAFNSSVLA
ncbi:hypothetical protein J4464_01650 [Candidatus Woesearchaeota archaeon]|nr:hypothetical protein [uncultured archaeon]MBS3142070.1 hypothetical protein [Candidatus Woesearchaeota archaeon]